MQLKDHRQEVAQVQIPVYGLLNISTWLLTLFQPSSAARLFALQIFAKTIVNDHQKNFGMISLKIN